MSALACISVCPRWFSLAAMAGNQKALNNREIAAQHMTPAEIAEAQKLAREWKPNKQPPQ
jgi:hypothetical protein